MKRRILTIDEYINESKLNEGAEELKAYDAIKAAMFKIKKPLEAMLKKALDAGLIKSYKVNIKPYNNGLELQTNVKPSWNEEIMKKYEGDGILNAMSNMYDVYIHPSSFFQSDLDENKTARLEGRTFKLERQDDEYVRFDIKSKADIKKAVDEFTKITIDKIDAIARKI